MPGSWGALERTGTGLGEVGGPEEGQGSPLTRKAVVAAALHVGAGQNSSDPHDLLKQPLPGSDHRDLVLAVRKTAGVAMRPRRMGSCHLEQEEHAGGRVNSVSELRPQRARPGGSGEGR